MRITLGGDYSIWQCDSEFKLVDQQLQIDERLETVPIPPGTLVQPHLFLNEGLRRIGPSHEE